MVTTLLVVLRKVMGITLDYFSLLYFNELWQGKIEI